MSPSAVEYVWLWVALLTSFFLYTGLAVFVYRKLNGQSEGSMGIASKMM
jgi:hypothetical protein